MSSQSILHQNKLSHEEYFALEQAEDWRYEYIAGDVFAMAGGSESHALIGANIIIDLGNALRGKPCRVYTSDMKLYVREYDKFCYPDIQVLCEQGIRHGKYVESPILIVEVLSDSNEAYDRNKKFAHYRSIATLKYYVLVDQAYKHVELYEKESKDRGIVTYPKDQLVFQDLDIVLDIEEIYRQVDFEILGSNP
jgi:Uma2 family endonuclease